jgi:hypothetical protein
MRERALRIPRKLHVKPAHRSFAGGSKGVCLAKHRHSMIHQTTKSAIAKRVANAPAGWNLYRGRISLSSTRFRHGAKPYAPRAQPRSRHRCLRQTYQTHFPPKHALALSEVQSRGSPRPNRSGHRSRRNRDGRLDQRWGRSPKRSCTTARRTGAEKTEGSPNCKMGTWSLCGALAIAALLESRLAPLHLHGPYSYVTNRRI